MKELAAILSSRNRTGRELCETECGSASEKSQFSRKQLAMTNSNGLGLSFAGFRLHFEF